MGWRGEVLGGVLMWFCLTLGGDVVVGVGDGRCWNRFSLSELCLIVRRCVRRVLVDGGGSQVSAAMLR